MSSSGDRDAVFALLGDVVSGQDGLKQSISDMHADIGLILSLSRGSFEASAFGGRAPQSIGAKSRGGSSLSLRNGDNGRIVRSPIDISALAKPSCGNNVPTTSVGHNGQRVPPPEANVVPSTPRGGSVR